jgi:hypothetical protein
MATNRETAIVLIEVYEKKYRNPDLTKYVISGLYDLYPDSETEYEIEKSWPNPWANSGNAGVYLFLNKNLEIVYIGKSNHLGYRLSNYFSYDENKKCKIKHTWKSEPRFVITIAVPDDSKFECSSLEEFLLSKIATTDNTLFNERKE